MTVAEIQETRSVLASITGEAARTMPPMDLANHCLHIEEMVEGTDELTEGELTELWADPAFKEGIKNVLDGCRFRLKGGNG